MLKSIDVLISLSVVMLVCSMAVTALTQAISNLINSRGMALKKGIQSLIDHLDPALEQQAAGAIADAVLRSPLITDAAGRLGTVIHRDEFTLMLMRLASQPNAPGLDSKVQDDIKALLRKNGILDGAEVLKGVHAMDLALESRHPQMAANIRREMAIVQVAGSDLVAKVHGSFDNVMDRASSRFTQYARYVTFFNGLIITLFLQLDCLSMVNRLSLDDSLRASMVAQANQLTTVVQQAGSSPDANAVDNSYIDFLNRNGILWTPVSPHDWAQHWKWSRLSGILVSFLLINLGAPFWYNALKTLLRLRSAAEDKDDSQRSARQAIPPPGLPPLPQPVVVVAETQGSAASLASDAAAGAG